MRKICAQGATERMGGVHMRQNVRTKTRSYIRKACAKHAILMSITGKG